MKTLLVAVFLVSASPCGAERDFEALRFERNVCKQYDLAVAVAGIRSTTLHERCYGWR